MVHASMVQLLWQLPKAELHLHLEGTLQPQLMFDLAQRNKVKLPFHSVAEVYEAYQFENLQSFLDIYYQGAQVLQTEQDFFDLTWAYLQTIYRQQVRHVEVFFDPQTHTQRGVAMDTVIRGIHRALEEGERTFGITYRLILCFLRHLSQQDALRTLEAALPYRQWITAVGLDSSEWGYPPEQFEQVFAWAQTEGFLTLAHAGEEGPPSYIWQALEKLQVSRIDHGVRCLEDSALVAYLQQHQIPLTVCPLSNVKLRVFNRMEEHPLKTMLEAGLCVTVNSDDPAYFGGYMMDNIVAVQEALSLSTAEWAQIFKNSFHASFLPLAHKQRYITEIDRQLAMATVS